MRTYEELLEWVEQNAADKGEGTTEDKTMWFVCVQEARYIRETHSIKDLADMVMAGFSGIRTDPKARIEEWLKDRAEGYDGGASEEDMAGDLVDDLREHFGLDE